jgi:hypothetical protein
MLKNLLYNFRIKAVALMSLHSVSSRVRHIVITDLQENKTYGLGMASNVMRFISSFVKIDYVRNLKFGKHRHTHIDNSYCT